MASPLDKLFEKWRDEDQESEVHALATKVVNKEVSINTIDDFLKRMKINDIIRKRRLAYQQTIMWS